MLKPLVGLAAAAAVFVSLAADPASAQMRYRFAPAHSWRQSPEVNNYLSARYDWLVSHSPRFRAYRMWKECRTINDPQLHQSCLASFDQYEPMQAGMVSWQPWHRHHWHHWRYRYWR